MHCPKEGRTADDAIETVRRDTRGHSYHSASSCRSARSGRCIPFTDIGEDEEENEVVLEYC